MGNVHRRGGEVKGMKMALGLGRSTYHLLRVCCLSFSSSVPVVLTSSQAWLELGVGFGLTLCCANCHCLAASPGGFEQILKGF